MRKSTLAFLATIAVVAGCQSPRMLVADRKSLGLFRGSAVITIYLENTPGKGDYGLIGTTTQELCGIHYEVPDHLRNASVGMIVAYDDERGDHVCQVSSVNTSADLHIQVPLPGVEPVAWAKVFGASAPNVAPKTVAPAAASRPH